MNPRSEVPHDPTLSRSRCACPDCRYWRSRRVLDWAVRSRGGTVSTLVDATEAKLIIGRWVREGWPERAVSRASGLGVRKVEILGRGEQAKTAPATIIALRAVTRAGLFAATPETGRVPATGTIRRIRALAWMGWTQKSIANADRVRPDAVHVAAGIHWKVAEDFERLQFTRGPAVRPALIARRQGWAPPLAWTDPDDPDEVPDYGATATSPIERFLTDARELLSLGEPVGRILARTGVKAPTAAAWVRRHAPDLDPHLWDAHVYHLRRRSQEIE